MSDTTVTKEQIVKSAYANIAKNASGTNGGTNSALSSDDLRQLASTIGYTKEDLSKMEGANLGLGCGNPLALQQIKRGDIVLDLGSGAGFDAFLAAEKVGMSGFVIGVDMTEEMLNKAMDNAKARNIKNVVFRRGLIEDLPVGDSSVDVILSNCVINLSQDKARVFSEAFRVLKPGGTLAISDIALNVDLPESIKDSAAMYAGCIAGAVLKQEYINLVETAGFENVRIESEINAITMLPEDILPKLTELFNINGEQLDSIPDNAVVSIYLRAVKN